MSFQGKTVIVTGSGAGMGRYAAIEFAKQGANVVVNSASASAQGTYDEIIAAGGKGLFVQGDVSLEETARNIVDQTIATFGRIDVLVNNAGVVYGGTVESMPLEDWHRMWRINVDGVLLMCRFTFPHMRKQGGGAVVNNASIAAIKALKDRSGYAATKGAVISLTKAMALECAQDNIRINAILPGTTLTPSLEARFQNAEDPAALRKAFSERQPIGRLGTEAELASAILFLAADENAFMTGAQLVVDGGFTM